MCFIIVIILLWNAVIQVCRVCIQYIILCYNNNYYNIIGIYIYIFLLLLSFVWASKFPCYPWPPIIILTYFVFFFYLGTSWYRLMPNIKLLDEIKGNDALLLQSCFPKGVIGLKSVKGMYINMY